MASRPVRLALAALAGLLLCAAFPPVGWWWAAVPSLAMLTWVLTRPDGTAAGGFGYGLVFGIAFALPLLPWISGLVGWFPWIALSLLQAVFPAIFGALAVPVSRLPGWPVWLALMWSLQEWLKSSIPFGGFPWGVVAFSQTDSPLLALARLGGAPLVSLAVALLGTSLAALAALAAEAGRGRPAGRLAVPAGAVAAVLLAVLLAAPGVRASATGGGEPAVTVAAVQGNVPRLGLDFASQRRAVLDNHVNETLRLARDVDAGIAAAPRFVIWPENSSDIDPLANADAAARIEAAATAIGAPILVGTVLARPDWTPQTPAASNTVLVWNPGEGPGERHDKQIVQPFGEYLPWRSFFSRLSPYAQRAGFFVPGDGSGVVHPAGVAVGVATCWEVIFDRALRESVRNGAQMLAIPTNNATFDEAMSEQQLAFARLRAVEHGRYAVVAGTTGISAAIAPDGRELARTGFFTPAYLDVEVRLRTQQTPATRWGGALQWVIVGAALTVAAVAILHNGGRVRTRPERHERGVA